MRMIPFAALALLFVAGAQADLLIATNSVWRYRKGTNEVSNPATAWRSRAYSDAAWPGGRAPFYYGESLGTGTVLSDMRNNYSSVFLRQSFQLANPAAIQGLELKAMIDDGFIAWLNGVEVYRYNVAAGDIPFNGLASNAPEPIVFQTFVLTFPRSALVNGLNILAIQAFNTSLGGSSDFVFNAELSSVAPDVEKPRLVSVTPPPGNLGAFGEVTVAFSEPVVGIDAIDLLLNDSSASSVRGSGASYTFTFATPVPGPLSLRFARGHGITDLATPGNAFDETAAGAQWNYELRDLSLPSVWRIHPPPGSSVRQLSSVEVWFTEPVVGLDAGDLLLNGQGASSVSGVAAGPYRFEFPARASGSADLSWKVGHGITDTALAPNPFTGAAWRYTIDPNQPVPQLLINEVHASNENGLRDEDGDAEDWIELFNRGNSAVNLAGWSLSDDPQQPGLWPFPSVVIGPGQYLVVFASGKDRQTVAGTARFHTNFKLGVGGEYLGLFNAELPRTAMSELVIPPQRTDYSYGRTSAGDWRYYQSPTPGAANGASSIIRVTEPVHFSVERGFFNQPFNVSLSAETGALVRYTMDGSEPTETRGTNYTSPILINRTTTLRAAAFKANQVPSAVRTHTYLYNLVASRMALPALSLVTWQSNLFGRTGIMETNPRNTTRHGIAWERPVSVEYIRPEDNEGFQIDAGIRIQGGGYVRDRYNPNGGLPFSKYSFRLYFRGDYGEAKLRYPLFPGSHVEEFDRIVLRAGMNDHSNPFISDELVRRLASDTGQVASHGTLVHLFINGVHKGYYNPTERIDTPFLQSWHGGGNAWDVIAQFGEIREGTATEWNSLRSFINSRDLSQPANFLEVSRRLDLENFIDYLLVNVYAATGDWPNNNWRAARERVPGAKFRFYVWDAEWSFGFRNGVTHNTLANELASDTDIGLYYRKLRASPEFRLLWADRIQKHFFNRGALTDTNVLTRFLELRTNMLGALPNMSTTIQRTWVPQRRTNIMRFFTSAGLLASSNAPVFTQHGGLVLPGFTLGMQAPQGTIYYTTNGSDPRVAFTGTIAPDAIPFTTATAPSLTRSLIVKARSVSGTNWSALTSATFAVAQPTLPLRITEIMYNPSGGDAYEYLELFNAGTTELDLQGMRFDGVDFMFSGSSRLSPGAAIILASSANPAAFAQRYPGVAVAGWFDGALANGGERVLLNSAEGDLLLSVDYDDEGGWPAAADGTGRSLEMIDVNGDPDDPANWRASANPTGSPGFVQLDAPAIPAGISLSEVMADNRDAVRNGSTYPDWIELVNRSDATVNLGGWSLSDGEQPRQFVFPANTLIAPGAFLIVWCDTETSAPGLHTGFQLNRAGESIFLYDASTNRIDGVTLGLQAENLSVGRVNGVWLLNRPTPGRPNEAAELAPSSELAINEWLANAPPGESDWIELHNKSATLPVSLHHLHLGIGSNVVHRLAALSFVAPGGHSVLFADELPGPDHLNFKLPAAGTAIVLRDELGRQIDRVEYRAEIEGVSRGRLPDGSPNIATFPASPSPGAANHLLSSSGPVLNEIMARSRVILGRSTNLPDWIELLNASASVADLSGMRLRLDGAGSKSFEFPPGTSIGPNGYRVVFCNPGHPASTSAGAELNTGWALPAEGGELRLLRRDGRALDSVRFGFQLVDYSVGRTDDGWHLLSRPTPGAANASPADLGTLTAVRLNEWLSADGDEDDWLELFNPDSRPVMLSGMFLTDDPSISGRTNHQVGPLSFIAPGSFTLWRADSKAADGPDHLGFNLDARGETLRLYSSAMALVDQVDIPPRAQASGSQGRFPDGNSEIREFAQTPSPDSQNYLPLREPIVISELLPSATNPFEGAIELHNPSAEAVELGGFYLSGDPANPQAYRIPDGATIAAHGFSVFYQDTLARSNASSWIFPLNSKSRGMISLARADASGRLTGERTIAEFTAPLAGESWGRVLVSNGTDFAPLSRTSFGMDSATSVEQFRTGAGKWNDYPRVGPIVFTEFMPDDETSAGPDAELLSFVELSNLSTEPIHFEAGHWRIRGGIDFDLPPLTLPADGFLVIVSFDPDADPSKNMAFRSHYGLPASVPLAGPYSGRLSARGESLELVRRSSSVSAQIASIDHSMDRVRYPDTIALTSPTPTGAAGRSWQKRVRTFHGLEPLNWIADRPSPGASHGSPVAPDLDGDGMLDLWETVHGLNPFIAEGAEDSDLDGVSNLNEFLSGTDPRDGLGQFRISLALQSDGAWAVQFLAAAGRAYRVERTTDLLAAWSVVLEVPAGDTRWIRVPVALGMADVAGFYRVSMTAE